MKKLHQVHRLTLTRETLHLLDRGAISRVAGGTVADSCVNTCNISCGGSCLETTSCVVCPPSQGTCG